MHILRRSFLITHSSQHSLRSLLLAYMSNTSTLNCQDLQNITKTSCVTNSDLRQFHLQLRTLVLKPSALPYLRYSESIATSNAIFSKHFKRAITKKSHTGFTSLSTDLEYTKNYRANFACNTSTLNRVLDTSSTPKNQKTSEKPKVA